MKLPEADAPVVHLRMPDYIYGFSTLPADRMEIVRPQNGVYRLQTDEETTLSLTIKRSPRFHRSKAGFIRVNGNSMAVVRPPAYVPTFVVTWRNSTKSLLVYVPVESTELLGRFPSVAKASRFSILECPIPAPSPHPPPLTRRSTDEHITLQ